MSDNDDTKKIKFEMTDEGPVLDESVWGSHRTEFCVYKLTNKVNLMPYVGRALDLCNRVLTYNRRIEEYIDGETDKPQAIVKALAEFGWTDFEMEILEDKIPRHKRAVREQWHIDNEGSMAPRGYNQQRALSKNPRRPKRERLLNLYFDLAGWRATTKERRALLYQIQQKNEDYQKLMIMKLHMYRDTGNDKFLKEAFTRQKVEYAKKIVAHSIKGRIKEDDTND